MSSSVTREQQKADFMEHLFQSYKPSNNCYTGLWKRFCISEAGPYCRDMYYERLAALKEYLATQSPQESNDN
jgi:hypothetical protein